MEIEYDEEGNVIGTNNSRRLGRLQALADNADQDADHKDLEPYIPDDPANRDNPEPEEEVVEEPVVAEEPIEPTEPAVEPRKFKLRVNGQDIEVTEQELIERAQKVEAADRYLREAVEQKRQAEEIAARVQVSPELSDDDRATARIIQLGSEEEAAQAIAKLRSPAYQPDQIIQAAVNRIRQESDATWFKDTYPDVFGDELTAKLAMNLDEEQLKAGDRRAPRERYQEIGNKLRTWRGTTPTLQNKVDAKRSVPAAIKPAAVRNTPPKAPDEETQSDSDIVSQMAKARGKDIIH